MKKFYAVVGNPPYQEENDSNGRKPPIYHLFMDESFKVADTVELVTPGRFLFNMGQTPPQWNEKMLNDQHFKVLEYLPDASEVFPNTMIKGGIAITIRNSCKEYGAIEVFSQYSILNRILRKVNRISPINQRLNTIFCISTLI